MIQRLYGWRSTAALAAFLIAQAAWAQSGGVKPESTPRKRAQLAAPPAPAASQAAAGVRHPWLVPQPGFSPQAYFTNLESGAIIETPFVLKFGLSGGWGLAPIAKPMGGKSGHHHLLINRDLPLDFQKPLPFNDQYVHFGKGQMETVLTLPPGNYTLRLLLADDKHLPHFVYSKPLRVTVTRKNAVDPQSVATRGIALLGPADGARLKVPFRVQFHASGFNVAHLSQQEKNTGHFRLTVVPRNGAPVELPFVDGQTEAWLAPPAGSYTLRLDLMDNTSPAQVLAPSATVAVQVE